MKAGGIGYEPEQHPTLRAGSNLASTGAVMQSVAIAANQRGEVRIDGRDGQTVGAIPATRSGKQLQGVLCMSTGQANAEVMEDSAPTLNASHEQPICVADDNANSAVDVDLSGSLKVGGGSPWFVMRRR